jgi:hypothetical protein
MMFDLSMCGFIFLNVGALSLEKIIQVDLNKNSHEFIFTQCGGVLAWKHFQVDLYNKSKQDLMSSYMGVLLLEIYLSKPMIIYHRC